MREDEYIFAGFFSTKDLLLRVFRTGERRRDSCLRTEARGQCQKQEPTGLLRSRGEKRCLSMVVKYEDVDVLERTGSLGAEPLMRVLMKAVPESLPNSPGGSWEVES